jgi:hypothetical protein
VYSSIKGGRIATEYNLNNAMAKAGNSSDALRKFRPT